MLLSLLFSKNASAGFEACGDIDIEANAKCEILLDAACRAKCEPVNFSLSCASELYVECGGMCELDAEVECTTSWLRQDQPSLE